MSWFSRQPYWRRTSYLIITYIFIIHMPCPAASSFTPDEAFLKNPENISIQFISERNTLLDKDGNEVSLTNLTHYTGLFSPDAYVILNHGRTAVHKRTRAVIEISVFRRKHDDGSVVLLSKTANGEIKHVLVARKASTTHFIPDKDQPGAFVTISSDDYDFSAISDQLLFGEERKPPSPTLPPATAFPRPPSGKGNNSRKRELRTGAKQRARARSHGTRFSKRHLQTSTSNSVNGDGSSQECTVFYVIPVTIFFDAEFCQLYSNEYQTTVSTIQMIVAAASIHYENNLCGKIELTGVYSDTTTCNPAESPFQQFNRSLCGSYLDAFTAYAEAQKDGLGLDPTSFIHLFTGLQFDRNLGCSWLPGPCGSEYVYGVGYMRFLFPDITGPAYILAHELGHNLGASHDPTSNDPPNYIMEATYNSGSDGFSPVSAEVISQTLQDPLNYCITTEPANQPPTNPTTSPSAQSEVSMNPSVPPLVTPSFVPTAVPTTLQPTLLPSITPTQRPPTAQPIVPPSLDPTSLPPPSEAPTFVPTLAPTTRRPSRRPSRSPLTAQPSPLPTSQEPTLKPSEQPQFSHPTRKPTTTEKPSTQLTPAPTTASLRPTTTCAYAPKFVDPVCVHASQGESPSSDFACYSKRELLVFVASSSECETRAKLVLEECSDQYLPYPGSSVLGSEHYDDDDENGNDGRVRRDLAAQSDVRYRRVGSGKSKMTTNGPDWERNAARLSSVFTPACSDSCSEVNGRICFRSTTEPGLDRWFRVRYTVRDPAMTSSSSVEVQSESMTVFVAIKENGQTECRSAGFVTCSGDSAQIRMWKDAGFRDFGE